MLFRSDETSRLVQEEQFGPIVPIMKFSDVEDAIRRANDTRYGLSGSVWTKDTEHGAEIASRLEVGTAWVNQHRATSAFVPFGGAKGGVWGLTRNLAIEGVAHGITANCISPVVICPTVAASAMASSFLRPNVTFSIIETKQSHRKFAISLYHRMAGFHAVNFGSYGEE